MGTGAWIRWRNCQTASLTSARSARCLPKEIKRATCDQRAFHFFGCRFSVQPSIVLPERLRVPLVRGLDQLEQEEVFLDHVHIETPNHRVGFVAGDLLRQGSQSLNSLSSPLQSEYGDSANEVRAPRRAQPGFRGLATAPSVPPGVTGSLRSMIALVTVPMSPSQRERRPPEQATVTHHSAPVRGSALTSASQAVHSGMPLATAGFPPEPASACIR